MSDRLAELLEHTADQYAEHALVPPMPAGWRAGTAGRRARAWRKLVPLAAAAAAVAVVVPVVLADGAAQDADEPVTPVGAPVRMTLSPMQDRFRSADAGLPRGPVANLRLRPCRTSAVQGSLDLAAGLLNIGVRRGEMACGLPDQVDVDLGSEVAVEHDVQPKVPNPPDFGGRMLDASGVLLSARWSGTCARVPDQASLTGLDGGAVPLKVTGTPETCGDGRSALTLGPAHRPGMPGAVVPADRAGLDVDVEVPEELKDGETFEYTVTLANPTDGVIALRPCPTYSINILVVRGTGTGDNGRLPCEVLPNELPGGRSFQVVGQATLPSGAVGEGSAEGPLRLTWQIAGPKEATATAVVTGTDPVALPDVPYLAPNGAVPAQSSFRYQSSGTFPVLIEAATRVRAGEVLRYRAVLTNPGGASAIPMRPCPPWTETFVVAPQVNPNPRPLIRKGVANCAKAPEQIEPGEQVAFLMELTIPPDAAPGPYQLFWQMHRGLASGPFDLLVTP